jgi:hypothetical protein
MLRSLVLAVAFGVAGIQPALAQSESLRAQCEAGGSAGVRQLCRHVADATVILQPRAALALSGGNPVPGTPSTLGIRLGTLPRLSMGLRVSAADVSLPPIRRVGTEANVDFPLGSINFDASLGVFPGFTLFPTAGGFASLDLLGSVGVIPLPHSEGFDDSSPVSWAAGARIGLLRESFTAPGVSIDVLHRRVGRIAWGSPQLTSEDAFLEADGLRVTSLRGVVGKRFYGVGLTGGVAWDRSSADFHGIIRDPVVLDPARVLEIREQGLTTTRTAIFGNASLTLLILNLAAEVGWQQGGAAIEEATDRLTRTSIFGGLAVRIAL